MPGLKSTFFHVILFLPDNLSWLEIYIYIYIYIQAWKSPWNGLLDCKESIIKKRKTNVLGVINLDSIERWKVAKDVSHLGNLFFLIS